MNQVNKGEESKLGELKKYIDESYTYFQSNNERYNEFVKFVFQTSLTQKDLQTLRQLKKPTLEFNILESQISRLRGEFAKQQPSLTVRAADGVPIQQLTKQFTNTLDVIEQHLRSIFFGGSNDYLEYSIYSDLLAGGFSVVEVYTEYINSMSFEQSIKVDRVFDPTLCGFDPLARKSHKGDGRYCFQIYPMTKQAFEKKYSKTVADRVGTNDGINSFRWTFNNNNEKFICVCVLYEKRKKKKTLVKLSNEETMWKEQYEEFIRNWNAQGFTEVPPIIVNKRETIVETIDRYELCESEILSHSQTDFAHLPLVFIDGNSVMISEGATQYQMTRPYVYHAKGIQRLKNYAGQSLGNELENITNIKLTTAIESVPKDYMEAYNTPQVQQNLMYHHLYPKNENIVLPPPQMMPRQPIPPEVTNTFTRVSDEMTQVILGNYDSTLGTNRQDISGAAIVAGAIQSNNTSVPYIMGYIKGINRVAQIIVDLIPKYYRTPRSIPILLPTGKRDYAIINQSPMQQMPSDEGMSDQSILEKSPTTPTISTLYNPNHLNVKVEPGVNFAMQKELALKMLINLAQAFPSLSELINSKGLGMVLDNVDIRGIDGLKAAVEEFQQQKQRSEAQNQQMQQAMMQETMQMQIQKGKADIQKSTAEAMKAIKEAQAPTKSEIEANKLTIDTQLASEKMMRETEFKEIEAHQKQQGLDMQLTKLVAELENGTFEQELKQANIDAEQARTAADTLHTLVQALSKLNVENKEETD